MTTSIETSVLAAVLATSAGHPLLFRQRLTITIRSNRGTGPAAGTWTAGRRLTTAAGTTPCASTSDLAEEAMAGLVAVVAGWVRNIATKAASGLERAMPGPLDAGQALAATLAAECVVVDGARCPGGWHPADLSTGWTWRQPEASGLASMVAGAGIDRRGR